MGYHALKNGWLFIPVDAEMNPDGIEFIPYEPYVGETCGLTFDKNVEDEIPTQSMSRQWHHPNLPRVQEKEAAWFCPGFFQLIFNEPYRRVEGKTHHANDRNRR